MKELKVSCSSPDCVTSWTKASASWDGVRLHSVKHFLHNEVDKNWRSSSERPVVLPWPLPMQGFNILDVADDDTDMPLIVVEAVDCILSETATDVFEDELVEDVLGR